MRPAALRSPATRTLALAVVLAALPGHSRATTYIWLGTSDNDWTTAANWQGGMAPPTSDLVNTDLIFANSGSPYPSIDGAYSIHSLTFTGKANAFSFDTGPLTLGAGGFTQDAANAEAFGAPVVLGADQTWTLGNGEGALTFGNGVNTTNGGTSYALTINAATTTGSGNVLNGSITGGGSLTKTGAGTLTLTGASTYTGATTVSAGTLTVGTGGSVTGGNVSVGAGATLAISGTGSVSPGSSYSLTVDAFNKLGKSSPVLAILSGTGSLSTGVAYVGYNGGGTFEQSGGSFTTNGNTLYLGYNSGSIGSYFLDGGMLTASNVSGGGGKGFFYFNGGTLQASVSDNPGAASNPTTFFSGLTTAIVQVGGALIDTNGFNVTIGQALTSQAPPGTTDGGLTKLGTGTLTLAGANTFTGGTSVSAGTLDLDNQNALRASTLLLVSGSGGVSFDAGVSGNAFTLGGLSGSGNLVLTNNAAAPAAVAVSVGANGASTTYSGVLSGPGSLTKVGAGTLTLSGANSYTGGTTVQAGTLVESNNGNALSTGTVAIGSGAVVALSNSSTTTTVSQAGATTFTGAGTLQKLGAGIVQLGGNGGAVNVSLSAGGLIDVEAGTLKGSSSNQGNYANNLGGLNIAAGATFDGVEGTIRVDALTGAGTLQGGYNYGTAGSTTIGVNNGSGTFSGVIQDSGDLGGTLTLTKVGTGTQTLSGNNTYSGATTISGGILQAGVASVAGTSGAFGRNSAVSLANVAGATLDLNNFATQIGSLTGGGTTGGNVTLGNATLTLGADNTSPAAYAGVISGTGGLTKLGTGTSTLTGANTYTGTTTGNTGTLVLNGGSTTSRLFQANSGGQIQYNGGIAVGGNLAGVGTQSVLAGGATFSSPTTSVLTIFNGVTLNIGGPTDFEEVNSSGNLTVASGATLTWNNGQNDLGTLAVSGTTNTSGWTSTGVITVNNGGALANSGSSLVLGGGSRTTINSGGTLSTASGTTVELNGGLLTNNGTENGTLDVNYGSTANGSGTFGNVNVNTGGKFGSSSVAGGGTDQVGGFAVIRLTGSAGLAATSPFVGPQLNASPGTTNVGSLTLHGGGTFSIRVQNATGAAGTGYDLTNASGTLTLAGDASATNQIVIALSSLNSNGTPGAAANFNPAQNYQFVLVQAGGGIVGYTGSGEFDVDTTGFANALQGGSFSVVAQGDDLVLDFNAVPEPSTWALLGVGAVGLGVVALRRRAGLV